MFGWGYNVYGLGQWHIRHFVFDSLEDYLDYLQSAPVQDVFRRGQASESGSQEFTLVDSLDEAIQLCRFGWHDGFSTLVGLTETIKRALDLKLDMVRTFHDYVGFAPDVKAYLEGSPLSMINKPPVHRELVTIYMNTSYDGSTRQERIFTRGAITLTIAEVLELMGYRVDLRLFEMSFIEDDVHFSEFRLKQPDERVNVQKLYFPLCHPAWVRRLNFRLIETTPDISEAWTGSYGIPADTKLMREILQLGEQDILIPTIDELGIKGEDVLADAQLLFDRVNVGLPKDKQLRFR